MGRHHGQHQHGRSRCRRRPRRAVAAHLDGAARPDRWRPNDVRPRRPRARPRDRHPRYRRHPQRARLEIRRQPYIGRADADKDPEAAPIYAGLVVQVMLAVLNACFRSFGAQTVDVLSVNGHVQTNQPGNRQTGPSLSGNRHDRPSNIPRSSISCIRNSTPKACLRKLGAEISPHPHDLEHINPIVDFDMTKYRIAYGPGELAKLDCAGHSHVARWWCCPCWMRATGTRRHARCHIVQCGRSIVVHTAPAVWSARSAAARVG